MEQSILPKQPEPITDQPADPSFFERFRSHPLARFVALGAATIGFAGHAAETASAEPNHTPEPSPALAAKAHTVKAPDFKPGTSVLSAQKLLKKDHLTYAGVKPDKDGKSYTKNHTAPAGYSYDAVDLDKKVVTHHKKHGKTITSVTYKHIKPGSRLAEGSKVVIDVDRVKVRAPAPEIGTTNPNTTPTPDITGGAPLTPPTTSPGEQQPPVTQPPTGGEQQPQPLNIETESRKFVRENTVYLPFANNCSALLLRDPSGKPIGAVSSEHCGYLPEDPNNPIIRGSNGQSYMYKYSLDVLQGDTLDDVQSIAKVKQVILPAENDRSMDYMRVVFDGATEEQVVAADNARSLSENDILSMPKGTQAFLAGMPALQPNIPKTSSIRLQDWIMNSLGAVNITTTSSFQTSTGQTVSVNRTLKTAMFSMEPNADGAVCSFGESGGVAVVPRVTTDAKGIQKISFRTIGSNGGRDDFRTKANGNDLDYDGPSVLLERQRQFGIDLTGVKVACYFTYKKPDSNASSTRVVNVVNDYSKIP